MVISAFCELPAGGALQRPNDADLWGQRLRARQGDGDGWDGSEISVKVTVNFIHFPRAVCLWRSRGNPDVHNCQEGFDYYLSTTSWHWKWDTSCPNWKSIAYCSRFCLPRDRSMDSSTAPGSCNRPIDLSFLRAALKSRLEVRSNVGDFAKFSRCMVHFCKSLQ